MRILALVTFGNFWYFFFVFLLIGLTALATFLSHKLGKKFAYWFIAVFLWTNFALHFLKQLLPIYWNQWPYSISDSFFPNLCATLIMFAPFIFHWGNPYFKDYFYYIGIISGFAAFLNPVAPLRTDIQGVEYALETARYYFCHTPLVVCGFLMVEQGFHKLNWKRWWAIPLMFGGVLAIVSLHEMIFGPILKFPGHPSEWFGQNGLLGRVYANQSMQFGPFASYDKTLGWLYGMLLPGLMVFHVDGVLYFTPVIWLIPLVYVATIIILPLMALPFEKKQMRIDVKAFWQKAHLRRLHRRAGR